MTARSGYRLIQPTDLEGIGDPVIVSTFMRSGTHLTIDLLRRQFPAFQARKRPLEALDSLYFPMDVLLPGWEPHDWSVPRALNVLRRGRRPILKSHFLDPDLRNLRNRQPAVASWLEERGTFLHVTRDPRQVLPSLWAFFPDWKGGDPSPFDESFIAEWLPQLRAHGADWKSRPGVRSLAYESITSDPRGTVEELSTWLGEPAVWHQPLLPPPLRSRWESRMKRIFACRSSSTAILARRPTPDWNPSWDALLNETPSCPTSSN